MLCFSVISYPFCHNEHLHGIAIDQDPQDLPVHLDSRNKPILRIFSTCKVIYVQKLRGGLNERYVIDSEKGRIYCKYCKNFISLNTIMFQDQARKNTLMHILKEMFLIYYRNYYNSYHYNIRSLLKQAYFNLATEINSELIEYF